MVDEKKMTPEEVLEYIRTELKDKVSRFMVGKTLQDQNQEELHAEVTKNIMQFWRDGLIDVLPDEPDFDIEYDESIKEFLVIPKNEAAESVIKLLNLQQSQI